MGFPDFRIRGFALGRGARSRGIRFDRRTRGAGRHRLGAEALEGRVVLAAPAAPTVSSVLDDKAPLIGIVPRNGSTNDATVTLVGRVEPGCTVEVFANSIKLGKASVVGSTWRFTTKALGADGAYSLTAQATNKAGQTSLATPTPYLVNLDTAESAPVITTALPAVTNLKQVTIAGTATAGSLVRIFNGQNPIGSVRANNAGVWNFTTQTLANGQTYRFAARAIDPAGNSSGLTTAASVLIDRTAPWRPLLTGVFESGPNLIADRGATRQNALSIVGRAEPGSTVDVYDGNVWLGAVVASPRGEWSFNASSLVDGVHPLRATAIDAAGNPSVLPSATYTVTVDSTIPAAPAIVSVVDGVAPSEGVVSDGGSTNDPQPLLSGTTELGTAVSIFEGSNLLGTADVTGTSWTFRPATPLMEGARVLTAQATDAVGNTSAASPPLTIVVDTLSDGFAGFGPLPADGTYGLGEPIDIVVRFADVVFVDGQPRIGLNTVPPRYAEYVSGSGTDTLRFRYLPELGDASSGLDFASADALDLNGGTIQDGAGNAVNPALPAPGSTGSFGDLTNIVVQARLTIGSNVPPTSAVSSGPLLAGPLPRIKITFNAPVTGFTNASFDLLLEDRSMTTEGVIVEDGGNGVDFYLTLPPATHQSLPGRYRLDIGGIGSGISSNGVLMDMVVSLYWRLP